MKNVFAAAMIVFAVIAFFYATRVLYNRNYRKVTYRLFSALAVASGTWSLGCAIMFWQDDPVVYSCFRAVGTIGIIGYILIGQLVLFMISGLIKKLWYVFAAECGAKNYDIVLLDHMMPEMDGVETMKRIRLLGGGYAKGGANLIIALTANALNGAREEMMSLGFDEFLSKPIDVKVLDEVFVKILDQSHYEYV